MKLVIAGVVVLLAIVMGYFAYINFIGKGDQPKGEESIWIEKCGDNKDCIRSVNVHYDSCANSVSFEKPNTKGKSEAEIEKMQSDISEYYSLITAEIEACLTEKVSLDLK